MSDSEGKLNSFLIHVPKNERHDQLTKKVSAKRRLNFSLFVALSSTCAWNVYCTLSLSFIIFSEHLGTSIPSINSKIILKRIEVSYICTWFPFASWQRHRTLGFDIFAKDACKETNRQKHEALSVPEESYYHGIEVSEWWIRDVPRLFFGLNPTTRHRHVVAIYTDTVYPKKYAHGFVVLCFVVVMQSFIMNSHEVFIHIHQGCFAGTGAIVRLPQCQWSKPDGYGTISQCITTTKHSKAKTVCIFLGIYCI